MRFCLKNRCLKAVAVLFILALALYLPAIPVSASGNTVINVSAPAQPVNPGEQFTVSVAVEPESAIAGIQFNLSFDPSLVTVNSISEGDLLKQNGDDTYFSPGKIDNQAGTITGSVGTIVVPGDSISTPGTFAVITLTAGSTAGTCSFTLSDVIAGDIGALPVPVNTVNGSITIVNNTPPPPSGGGGGGGGFIGGGGSGTGSTPTPTPDSNNTAKNYGLFDQTTRVKSGDGAAELVIDQGTKGLTQDGKAIDNISILAAQSPSAQPDQSSIIGTPYEISPDGAAFDRPIDLTFVYNPALIPQGVDENKLVVATWDDLSSRWIDLSSTVDPQNNTISAQTVHFSLYCVLAHTRPAAFTITDLSLQPSAVEVNGSVNVSALISNSGDISGTYKLTLKMDGADFGTQEVTLAGGSNQRVTFNITAGISGTHILSIGDLTGELTVREPAKAAFVLSNLTLSASEISIGDTITIGAQVANTGNIAGTQDVLLKINGTIESEKQVTLDAGTGKEVNFTAIEQNPGTYLADINGLTVSFLVKEASPVIASTPVSTETTYSTSPAVPPVEKASTPESTIPSELSEPVMNQFSLSLLAEMVGGAFVLIAATTSIILLRRRQLLRRNQN